MVDQIHDKRTYGVMGPRGDTPTVEVITPTDVLNPNQNPSVTNDGDDLNVRLHFKVPRAERISKVSSTTVTPVTNPSVSNTKDSSGDSQLAFKLPRAAKITAVTATGGDVAAVKQTVDANGDSSLAFTLPKGPKGDKGEQGDSFPTEGSVGDVLIKTDTGVQWGDGRDKRIYTNDGSDVSIPAEATRGAMPTGGTSSKNRSLAIGIGARTDTADGSNATAIGNYASATGLSTAIGDKVEASNGGVAIGAVSTRAGVDGTAIGVSAASSGNSVTVGNNAKSQSTNGVAIGTSAFVVGSSSYNAIAIGPHTQIQGSQSTAIGYDTNVSAKSSTAVGSEITSSAESTTIVGYRCHATGSSSVLIGTFVSSSGYNTVTIGNSNYTYNKNSVNIGYYAFAHGANSVIIGPHAGLYIPESGEKPDANAIDTNTANSVALGSESTISTANEVSVGTPGGTKYYYTTESDGSKTVAERLNQPEIYRRITNVGTPTKDHDAATKEYVDNYIPTFFTEKLQLNTKKIPAHETIDFGAATLVDKNGEDVSLSDYSCAFAYIEYTSEAAELSIDIQRNIEVNVRFMQVGNTAWKLTKVTNNNDKEVTLTEDMYIITKLTRVKEL